MIKMGVFINWNKMRGKPEGWLGEVAAKRMNRSTQDVSDWGIGHLEGVIPRVIVDLGCGGGRNLKYLLDRFPKSKGFGLDHSEAAIAVAKKESRELIESKRCMLLLGEAENLPVRDGVADLVTAFDTVAFWEKPVAGLGEARRVLHTEGVFMLVQNSDGIPNENEILPGAESAGLTREQLCSYLKEAGFSEIVIDHDEARHRLCIVCRK